MTNLIGQTLLNQYRVDHFIAAGGMGAVYRVWDTKRNVPLAMKVLHSDLIDDPTAFKSFQREANALRKLTHPNIVPFYGLYSSEDFAFLLQQFIDGPSLRDVMRKYPTGMPVDEVIIYLKALCAALGYAHAHGIVHCDIKPGNVMLERNGQIYLTDFGIARYADSGTTTIAGAGTPSYMAPEQILLQPVFPATDVYALGILFFEMLTGHRPFKGDEPGTEKAGSSSGERIRYAHVKLQPPCPTALNSGISQALEAVILKALSKSPRERYADAFAFYQAIVQAVGFSPTNESPNIASLFPPTQPEYPQRLVPISEPSPLLVPKNQNYFLLAGGGLLFLLLMFFVYLARGSQPTEFVTQTGSNQKPTLQIEQRSSETPSPTFTNLPIETRFPAQPQLPTSTNTPKPPDGPTGRIVFTCQVRGVDRDQICIMNADGSNMQQLTDDNHQNYYPSIAPDGDSIVFVSNRSGQFEIYELNLTNDQLYRLTNGIGEPSAPEISPNGSMIVFTNNRNQYTAIWLMGRDGSNPQEIYGIKGKDSLDPTWSPDSKRILFAFGVGEQKQLYIINADGSGLEKIITSVATRGRSDWSPDGRFFATYSGASWHREIFIINTDSSGEKQISNGGNVLAPSFSPDSLWITFTGYIDNYGDNNGCEIYIMTVDGKDVRRLTDNRYCDYQPRWGP